MALRTGRNTAASRLVAAGKPEAKPASRSAAESGDFQIGAKIKGLRRERGVTLQTMADEIGFSPALISQIENHNVSPPIATLARIARYFDVPMAFFFDEEEGKGAEYEVVRASDRKRVRRVINPLGTDHGYTYEALCSSKGERAMEPFLLTVAAGVRDEESLYSHEGQEFLFVLEGQVVMLLGNDRVELEAGDSLYFNSALKHRMLNPGKAPSRVLAVIARGESKSRKRRKERADL